MGTVVNNGIVFVDYVNQLRTAAAWRSGTRCAAAGQVPGCVPSS